MSTISVCWDVSTWQNGTLGIQRRVVLSFFGIDLDWGKRLVNNHRTWTCGLPREFHKDGFLALDELWLPHVATGRLGIIIINGQVPDCVCVPFIGFACEGRQRSMTTTENGHPLPEKTSGLLRKFHLDGFWALDELWLPLVVTGRLVSHTAGFCCLYGCFKTNDETMERNGNPTPFPLGCNLVRRQLDSTVRGTLNLLGRESDTMAETLRGCTEWKKIVGFSRAPETKKLRDSAKGREAELSIGIANTEYLYAKKTNAALETTLSEVVAEYSTLSREPRKVSSSPKRRKCDIYYHPTVPTLSVFGRLEERISVSWKAPPGKMELLALNELQCWFSKSTGKICHGLGTDQDSRLRP
ncbi:hypothetical protein BC832DRAFT_542226 [Gaertneriomyces semiglobifer]|nr:hypothetical protein BC832DRAFT_542226 [Gaertneriomyces semiglobifer]